MEFSKELAERVKRARREQGLPEQVVDTTFLARLARSLFKGDRWQHR